MYTFSKTPVFIGISAVYIAVCVVYIDTENTVDNYNNFPRWCIRLPRVMYTTSHDDVYDFPG